MSSKGDGTLFCLIHCCIPVIRIMLNECMKTHTCTSNKSELTGNTALWFPLEMVGFLHYHVSLDSYKTKTMSNSGEQTTGLESWCHEVNEWTEIFLFWFLAEYEHIFTKLFWIFLNIWRKHMKISDRHSVPLLTLQKWLRLSYFCINLWWLALKMGK